MYEKIRHLSTDVKDEKENVDELFDKHEPYENCEMNRHICKVLKIC